MRPSGRQNGDALRFASEERNRDRDVAMKAVRQRGWALQYAWEGWNTHGMLMEYSLITLTEGIP